MVSHRLLVLATAVALIACRSAHAPRPVPFAIEEPQDAPYDLEAILAIYDAAYPVDVEGLPSVSARQPPPTPPSALGGSPPDSSLPSLEELADVIRNIVADPLVADHALAYNQILNDCQHRAHVAAAYLISTQPRWYVGKVFVRGSLQPIPGLVNWGFHVAPYVVGRDPERGPVLLVIDPAFDRTRALPLVEWLELARGGGTITNVLLRSASAWGNLPATAAPSYARDVQSAADELAKFRAEHKSRIKSKTLCVRKVTPTRSRVAFDGTNDFIFRYSELGVLTDALGRNQPVTIEYERVPRTGLVNRLLRRNFLLLQGARLATRAAVTCKPRAND